MVTSGSRLAYGDCFDIFDKALEDEHGGRVLCNNRADAVHLRTRLHSARTVDRTDNARTYDRDHIMHGRSVYDGLAVRIKEFDQRTYVYVEKIKLDKEVEPLSLVLSSGVGQIETPEPPKMIGFRRV